MEKLVYVLRGPDPDALAPVLTGDAAAALLDLDVAGLTVNVRNRDVDISRSAASTDDPEFAGLVSLWLHSLDDAGAVGDVLLDAGDVRLDGYLVTESVPIRDTARDWPDGTPTPGPVLLTLFTQPEGLADGDFFRFWHGSHTPLSLEIHPFRSYVRNVVVRRLTLGAPPWRGIVTETLPDAEHLSDPMLLFGADGDPERMAENMRRSMDDGARFLDFDGGVQTYATTEVIVRSFGSLAP